MIFFASLKWKVFANLAFSHDVIEAILALQWNEMVAMLVFQTNPVGDELSSYINAIFFVPIDAGHMNENAL